MKIKFYFLSVACIGVFSPFHLALADDASSPASQPKTVVVDFTAPQHPEYVVIRFADGREINISLLNEATKDKLFILAGDLHPTDKSKIQDFVISPGATNVIDLSTKVESQTEGELKKINEQRQKKTQNN